MCRSAGVAGCVGEVFDRWFPSSNESARIRGYLLWTVSPSDMDERLLEWFPMCVEQVGIVEGTDEQLDPIAACSGAF